MGPTGRGDQGGAGGVAVVGAGIAGLACARALRAGNLDVRLFDKGRRPGGRCSSRRRGRFQFDHGAQYFTARDSEFLGLIDQLIRRQVVSPWRGRIAAIDDGRLRELDDGQERLVGQPSMSALPRALADGLDVVSGCRIVHLERQESRWHLVDEAGRDQGHFDWVVLALPRSQGAALAPPSIADELDRRPMTPTLTLLAHMTQMEALSFDAAFVNGDAVLSWIARDGSKPGRPHPETWVLHANEGFSTENFSGTDIEVARRMRAAFEELTGRRPRYEEEQLMRWRFAGPGEETAGTLIFDEDARIGACGDWCRGGRIEGAWLSGRAMARRILEAHRS